MFAALNPCLVGDRASQPYLELAQRLGMTESAIKSAVHRLRRRYRELLREEIAQTLSDPAQIEEEVRALFSAFA